MADELLKKALDEIGLQSLVTRGKLELPIDDVLFQLYDLAFMNDYYEL